MKVRCQACKEYVERDEALRTGVMSFCDSDCLGKYSKKVRKHKPKKNPMPTDLRMEVMHRDKQRCCYCGTSHSLVVHHVRYLSEGGQHHINNLVTLCDKHHTLVHTNKSLYKPLLLTLIDRRSLGDTLVLLPSLMVE